jgi:hypothetical protein
MVASFGIRSRNGAFHVLLEIHQSGMPLMIASSSRVALFAWTSTDARGRAACGRPPIQTRPVVFKARRNDFHQRAKPS